MSEKHLTELPWKTLVVKQKLKDPGLGKTLAVLEHAEESDLAGRLRLLDVVAKQAKAFKAEQKGAKEIVAYLDEMLNETEKARKTLKLQAGKAKEEEEEDEAEEEEEADAAEVERYRKGAKGALLTTLAKVRADGAKASPGQSPPAQRFIAYLAGANNAVLVAKSISGLQGLLPELAGGVAGGKYVKGSCIFEKGAHTFVVARVPAGLALAISKGLRAVTGTKFKVRVRSEDGLTVDEDGEEQEGDAGATLATQFQARRQGIEEAYLASLRGDSPDAGKIRALLAYVDGAAEAGDLVKAMASLDKMEAVLASKGSALDPAFLQEWSSACSGVRDVLRQVQEAVTSSDDLNAAPAILCLQSVGKNLAHRPSSRTEVNEMESWISTDDVIALLETPNPFGIPVDIRGALLPVLGKWKDKLPA